MYFLHGELIIWKAAVSVLVILDKNCNLTNATFEKTVVMLRQIPEPLCTEEELIQTINSIRLVNVSFENIASLLYVLF